MSTPTIAVPPLPPPDEDGRAAAQASQDHPGWRRARVTPSLAEVYRTIPVTNLVWWRKILAFAGPGYLVAVGYMDPGNWATDLAGGSRFGYTLLTVILMSNLMAVLLQGLASKLGIVTGRDLAQACRDHYTRPVAMGLWVLCEIAIAACDLAEVIGTAIALNLLFGIPLEWGVIITALDVLLVLYLQNKGFRLLEALVIALVATVGMCFFFELWIAKPDMGGVMRGFIPNPEILRNPEMLYIAIGILGATVMPHNLYLHSSIVQTRNYEESLPGKREAVRYAFIDHHRALLRALHQCCHPHRRGGDVPPTETHGRRDPDAYQLLTPLLGLAWHRRCRARASRLWAELTLTDAGGSDRHGRFPQHPVATVLRRP